MNLLLVAYYFPPINSGGTQRPVKFASHLRRLGHRVKVLTHTYGHRAVAEPHVLRVPDPSYRWERRGARVVQWGLLRLTVEALNLVGVPASIYGPWRRRALRSAGWIRAEAAPDVIVATYPPIEDLEIGLGLARGFGTPLVADFRDGLMFEPVERVRIARHGCIRRHYSTVERAVAERAAAVVSAFPSLTEYFTAAHGVRHAVTIPNGYDAEDDRDAGRSWSFDPATFNLVHTGRFGGSDSDRDVGPLCSALEGLVAREPAVGERLRIHLVGPLERCERRRFAKLIELGVVVCHGLCPLPVALASQRAADALLVLTSVGRPGHVPGKLLEYLHAGRPILGLTTAGSYCDQVLRETGAGFTVDPRDVAAISGVLRRLALQPETTAPLRRDEAAIAAFERERQVVELEQVLRSVASAG